MCSSSNAAPPLRNCIRICALERRATPLARTRRDRRPRPSRRGWAGPLTEVDPDRHQMKRPIPLGVLEPRGPCPTGTTTSSRSRAASLQKPPIPRNAVVLHKSGLLRGRRFAQAWSGVGRPAACVSRPHVERERAVGSTWRPDVPREMAFARLSGRHRLVDRRPCGTNVSDPSTDSGTTAAGPTSGPTTGPATTSTGSPTTESTGNPTTASTGSSTTESTSDATTELTGDTTGDPGPPKVGQKLVTRARRWRACADDRRD